MQQLTRFQLIERVARFLRDSRVRLVWCNLVRVTELNEIVIERRYERAIGVQNFSLKILAVVKNFSENLGIILAHPAYLIGSRPSDHYFRSVWFVCLSVCLFVCLCSFSQPSLIRFRSN